MPTETWYKSGGNYVPGDWPSTLDTQAANEAAFTDSEGQELSTAVQVPEAAQAALEVSGDARRWAGQIAVDAVGAPSTLDPDIQGNQLKQKYLQNHLYP